MGYKIPFSSVLELVFTRNICGFSSIILLQARQKYAGVLSSGKYFSRRMQQNLPKRHLYTLVKTGSYLLFLADFLAADAAGFFAETAGFAAVAFAAGFTAAVFAAGAAAGFFSAASAAGLTASGFFSTAVAAGFFSAAAGAAASAFGAAAGFFSSGAGRVARTRRNAAIFSHSPARSSAAVSAVRRASSRAAESADTSTS